ncbi:MAG: sugar-binding transcriptional regulator [bacterium]
MLDASRAGLDRDGLLATVARLYYEEGLTQADIASQIHTSRSTVSRLLQEAREAGIVRIVIDHPWSVVPQLEEQLVQEFGLRKAIVLTAANRPYNEVLRGLGVLAAHYLESVLEQDMILGINWGTGVYSTVQALRPNKGLSVIAVQVVGTVGAEDRSVDGPELLGRLCSLYTARCRYLNAPLILQDISLRDGLLQEPSIRQTLSLARRADIMLMGVGSTVPERAALLRAGHIDREMLAELRSHGAVGDVCGHHFDIQGRVVETPLSGRVVGIELDALDGVAHLIAVAGGRKKAKAILGALRGKYLNVLVTDSEAAKMVLASRSRSRPSSELGESVKQELDVTEKL